MGVAQGSILRPGRAQVEPRLNWPSIVWVREGLASRDILVSSRTSDSCGRPGAVRANQVARCTVFHLDLEKL